MEARLVVIGGKTNHSEIKLKLPSVFGRGRDADITIAHAAVSRQHCRLEELDGALVLRDNGSTNGTFFGKKRVKEIVIRPGDLFSIGPLTFRAEYEHQGAFPTIGEPRPEVLREELRDDDATIQFAPGADELQNLAAAPASDDPLAVEEAAGTSPAEDALDELDFTSPDEAPAGKISTDDADAPQTAAADSGIDFFSDPEPAASTHAKEAEEPAASNDDDDFMAAFAADEPGETNLAAADDPLAGLTDDPEVSAAPALSSHTQEIEEPAASNDDADDFMAAFSADEPAETNLAAADDPLAGLTDDSELSAEPAASAHAKEIEEPGASNDDADDFMAAFAADEPSETNLAAADDPLAGLTDDSEVSAAPAASAHAKEVEEPAASNDDADDFMAAFATDEPAETNLAAADDPLAGLTDDSELSAESAASSAAQEIEEPASAASSASADDDDDMFNFASKESDGGALAGDLLDDPMFDEVSESVAKGLNPDEPAAEDAISGHAAGEVELDFDLNGDSAADGDQDEDTAEMALSPPEKRAREPEGLIDELPDDGPQFAPAIDDEEFDPFADDPAPAAASASAAADELTDFGLGDADDDAPASPPSRAADKAKAKSAKEKPGKEKPAKEKPAAKAKGGKDKAAGGWWPFAKAPKKPAVKSEEAKEPEKSPVAAQPKVSQPAAPQPKAPQPKAPQPAADADDDEMPDFFEAASTSPAAASAKSEAAEPQSGDSGLDFLGTGSESSSAKPAEQDDDLDDFFQDLGLK